MRLRAAILVEVAVDPVAEGDDAEELAWSWCFLRVERFDGPAKLGQVGADAGVLVDRLHRPVEEAVRRAGRLGDLLAAHRRQLVDLLAEFGAVGIERGKLVDELRDALVEFGRLLGSSRGRALLPRPARPAAAPRADRASACVAVVVSAAGSVAIIQSFQRPLNAAPLQGVNGCREPCKRLPLYYRCNTRQCQEARRAPKSSAGLTICLNSSLTVKQLQQLQCACFSSGTR